MSASSWLRLQPHLISSPHYNPFQSAYRSCHSTETALLTLLNKTRLSADQGESTLLVSLDLSAAFDTIDHAILLTRLRLMYGVDGTALNWLRSYLTQRFQYVKVGQDISPSVLLSTGVPQGSVLGPILFTSFISPFNLLPPISRLISNSMRMTPSFSYQFQKPTLSTRSAALRQPCCTSLPGSTTTVSLLILRNLKPSSSAPTLETKHLAISTR